MSPKPSAAVARAYRKALAKDWTEDLIEEETAGPSAWECYKAIMNGLTYAEYRRIVNTGGSVRYIPNDGEGL